MNTDREENPATVRNRKRNHSERLAARAHMMGGGKQQAAEDHGQNQCSFAGHAPARRNAQASQRQQDQPEQQFLVDSRPEETHAPP